MLLWFAGTAGMAYILQSRLHLWLSVPLFIVFLGWLRQRWAFGFSEFDFLFDEGGRFFSLLPALGTGLISLGILHRLRKETQFGEQTLFHWGLFLTLVTIIIGTAAQEAFFTLFDLSMDAVTVVIVVASFALAPLSTHAMTAFPRERIMPRVPSAARPAAVAHPLDPLDAKEVNAALAVLKKDALRMDRFRNESLTTLPAYDTWANGAVGMGWI
jgi:hypothetical protein